MITRRVHNREFRLRPGRRVNAIVEYVIAVLVRHYALELHAFNVLSTHYHCRFFDPLGRASDFARDAHAMIAKLIIHAFGEDDESLWSPSPANLLEDESEDGAIDHIAYIMTNAAAAGLVKFAKDWPGAKGRWPQRTRTVKQPRGFFQEDTWAPGAVTASGRPQIHWSKTGTLEFTRPRGYDDLSDNELAIAIDQAIRAREKAAHEKWRGVQGAFPGKKAVQRVSRRARAKTPEPKRGAKRIPTIRCSDSALRQVRLSGIREWRRGYRASLKEWPTNRDVVFPLGTNKMRVLHRVNVDEPPT